MFLNNGKMFNSDGRSGSIPVLPNHLPDKLIMTGYNWTQTPDGNTVGNTRSAAFDGSHLWAAPKNGQLIRIDIKDGNKESFHIKIASNQLLSTYNSPRILYAGGYIWLLALHDKSIIKVDTQSLEMSLVSTADGVNGNSNVGIFNAEGAIYDGEYVWIASGSKLIKFNINNENFTGYDLPVTRRGIIHTGESLYLFGAEGKKLIRVQLPNMVISEIEIPSEILSSVGFQYTFYSGIFDGEHIWLPMAEGEKILQYTPATGEMKGHIYTGDNLGDIPEQSQIHSTLSESCIFDGRYIWTAPVATNRILRVDTQTGNMKGYDFSAGTNLGNIAATDYKFSGIVFDGINIWLIPNKADKIVQLAPSADSLSKTITEQYQDEQGNQLKSTKTQYVVAGQNYNTTAQVLSGYTCIGHKVDGGAMVAGNTVAITNVTSDHIIIFLYKRDDDGGSDGNGQGGSCCCTPIINMYSPTIYVSYVCNCQDNNCK